MVEEPNYFHPYMATHYDEEDIEELLAEEDLDIADLFRRDGVSLPGWYWFRTAAPHRACSPREGRMIGPYLRLNEAFEEARKAWN